MARVTDRMCGSGERRPLHRGPLLRPVVPEHHLARVGAADDQVRVEAGERGAHHRRLAVEDILGRRLLELGVPHEADAVRVVRRLLIVVVAVGREYREGRLPTKHVNISQTDRNGNASTSN